MVTRIYTPPIQPYAKPKVTRQDKGEDEGRRGAYTQLMAERQAQAPKAPIPAPDGQTADAPMQPSLHSLQAHQQNMRIPLTAVLKDFTGTMDALGADETTRSEVSAYLNVIHLQAGKDKPEIPFIKHSLRTAAGTLDQFITQALGQPSRVVREWVDALLLQDIDYKLDNGPPSIGVSAAEPEALPMDEMPGPGRRMDIRQMVAQAKQFYQGGQSEAADTLLEQAIQTSSNPGTLGKLWNLRGRFAEQSGGWEKAVHAYDQAAGFFGQAGQADRQAQVLYAAASLLDERNQPALAMQFYQQVAGLDRQQGNAAGLVRTLNDLGSLQYRQGQVKAALESFQEAYLVVKDRPDLPVPLTADLLSNIGQVYRQEGEYHRSLKAYQLAAGQLKNDDPQLYKQVLRQLLAVADAGGFAREAAQARQKLAALSR